MLKYTIAGLVIAIVGIAYQWYGARQAMLVAEAHQESLQLAVAEAEGKIGQLETLLKQSHFEQTN